MKKQATKEHIYITVFMLKSYITQKLYFYVLIYIKSSENWADKMVASERGIEICIVV